MIVSRCDYCTREEPGTEPPEWFHVTKERGPYRSMSERDIDVWLCSEACLSDYGNKLYEGTKP